jgi:hypothetical protein
MVKGKGHRIDSGKILVVEKVLLTRQPSALATEIGGKRPDDRVEDWDRRHLNSSAPFLQQLAKRVTNQSEQNNALVRLDSGDDALNLTPRPDHTPDVLDRLRSVELHKAGSGYGMHGFSGGIRNQMKMKSRHSGQNRDNRVIPAALCIIQ